MIEPRLCVYEYEEILMGKKKNFSYCFNSGEEERKKEVGAIWRYAVEKLFKWTPDAARRYMTDEIVYKYCLDKTFTGIGFRREGNYIPDYTFILQYAFPEEIHYSLSDQTIDDYEKVAKLGKYSNSLTPAKFPKKFFLDDNGEKRAKILMRYVVRQYIRGAYTEEEAYEFFADRPRAMKWLQGKKLDNPVRLIFESPLDYYHESLPSDERNDFLYYAMKCRTAYEDRMKS